ncbi:MAG: PDZ domain-containing protein [Deltaproteobacteria bacterium]|nr:PDZ domain-containing protein [Deltaproteobacteria bacterium]
MIRRGIVAATVLVASLAGCDGTTGTDGGGTGSGATPRANAANAGSAGMPLAEIGIRQQGAGEHDYRVDQDAIIQVMVLAASGALAASPLPGGTGYRIDAVPEGSVLALAGLQAGDEVTAINGMPLSGAEGLQRGYTLMRSSKAVVVTVIRKGQPLAFHYEVSRTALSRSDRLPTRRRPQSTRSRLKLETLKDDIKKVSDHTYEVSPTLVEELTSEQLMRSARIIPKLEGGKVVGMKLYGIRRSSVLGALGFQNGDTITAINGQPVASPDRMLELYSKLTPTPGAEATVEVLRKGEPITLRYRVRKESSPPPSSPPKAPLSPRIQW